MPARLAAAVLLFAGCAALTGCHRLAGHAANERGKRLYAAGNFPAAREEFRRAALDDPAEPDFRHNLAAAVEKAPLPGGVAAVERFYRDALALDPDHQPTVHKLAELYLDTGRPQLARDLTANWATARPEDPRPHVELAAVARRTGDAAAAERSLMRALEVAPGDATALAKLGELYEQTGRPNAARTLYAEALEENWNQPGVADRLERLRR